MGPVFLGELGSVPVNVNVTLLVYQLLLPIVPESVWVVTGSVLSILKMNGPFTDSILLALSTE